MPHYKIICRVIRDQMLKKDPYGFQTYNLCKCKHPFCNSKFKDNENYFPRNYEEFKKCINTINGKSGRNS